MERKLCGQCELLSLDLLEPEYGHLLGKNVAHLRDEANRDDPCSMCSLIWWSLRHDRFCIDDRMPVRLFLNPPPQKSGEKLQRVDVIATNKDISEFLWLPQHPGEPWHLGPPDYNKDICRGHLTLYVSHDNLLSSKFKYRPLSSSSESDQCIQIARHWLDQCEQDHSATCQNDYVCNLPTRLVDLGSLEESVPPKLISTAAKNFSKSTKVKYTALSYCWGKKPFFKTTPTNMDSLMSSIPWDGLPKTVRDAITLTRKLRIRYLWVDCLCIIQGDDPAALLDWQNESSKMHDIYGAAFLTIAAADAFSADQGLFSERPSDPIPSCPLKSKYPRAIHLGADPPQHLANVEPLNTRGWAFQEQILSSRILIYGKAGLSWKCRSSMQLEAEIEARPHEDCLGSIWMVEGADPSEQLNIRDKQSKLIHKEWKRIVEEYSRREFTYVKDKLPALFGVSELVERSCKHKYLAGLWDSDLVPQLLWRHCGKLMGSSVDYTRGTQYRAPSWSWASVDGRVQFIQGYQTLPSVKVGCRLNAHTSQQVQKMMKRPLHMFAVIRQMPSIRCDHFGRYYGGAERETRWIAYRNTLRTYLDDIKVLPSGSVLDRPDRPKQLLDPFFLFLGWKAEFMMYSSSELANKPPGTYGAAGLILLKIDCFTFRRIGVFEGFLSGDLRVQDMRRWIRIV
ncbi:heterokaryon incompatibility protein-domain-containing protein [Leptodontidium sp. 2 PMI_412]|nr:heterokaryon incompatibility protein-domain-containing protein [Leptodontidium sp. 2 PMI_412]